MTHPHRERPWEESEKAFDPNYGRTCICGAAIRAGGRILHDCPGPLPHKPEPAYVYDLPTTDPDAEIIAVVIGKRTFTNDNDATVKELLALRDDIARLTVKCDDIYYKADNQREMDIHLHKASSFRRANQLIEERIKVLGGKL